MQKYILKKINFVDSISWKSWVQNHIGFSWMDDITLKHFHMWHKPENNQYIKNTLICSMYK